MPFSRKVTICLAAILLLGGTAAAAERLGRTVVPTFEAIRLDADRRKADYTGTARIELKVNAPTDAFRFHALDMDLKRITLRGSQGDVPVRHQAGERGIITVNASGTLTPGAYTLEIGFANNFDTHMNSFFKVESRGEPYLFTQFEPDMAREAFPCWDEPEFKIPFQLTLVVPKADLAVANTPVEKEAEEGARKTVVFRRTRPIPSYLVAFAAGPFETVPLPGMSVPGRVVFPRGQSHLTGETVKYTPVILGALEKYFGRAYPYEKLDLIAVPGFGGAMENAGAVTFNDSLLLLDPQRNTLGQRANLVGVVAHELAHMWFGDLVTMQWWDDLWLNESFASWMGDKISEQVAPELGIQVAEISGANAAMMTDAHLSTGAMRRSISASDNLMQSFDDLAYPKGQRVLMMFEAWMGPDVFRRGIQEYLQAHEWGNARAADLWQSLSKAAGRDVGAAMSSFLDQAGVPLVSIEPAGANQVRISQQRFLNQGNTDARNTRWQVPVTLRFPDGSGGTKTQSVLLTQPSQTVRLDTAAAPAWVHPNAGENGYYRWKVSHDALAAMASDAARLLNTRERAGVVKNISALLDAGALEGPDFLRLVAQFSGDADPYVAGAVFDALEKIKKAFITPETADAFAAYVRRVVTPAVQRFGMKKQPGEPDAVSALRPRFYLLLAVEGKDQKVLAEAEKLAQAYLKDPASVDPPLAGTVLRLAALRGDEALFETYRRRFEAATIPADRGRFLRALGGFRDPKVVQHALKYTLEGPLRVTEINSIPFGIGSDLRYQDVPFHWMVENFDRLKKRMPDYAVASLPNFAVDSCSTEQLERAKKFFADPAHRVAGTDKTLRDLEEWVNLCVRRRAREAAAVTAYLKSPR